MTQLRCDKEFFLKELEKYQAIINAEDWQKFFENVHNDMLSETGNLTLLSDFFNFVEENGYNVSSKITCTLTNQFYHQTLKDLDLKNVEDIFWHSFVACSGSIILSSKVSYMGSNAFLNCDNAFTIIFDGTLEQWEAIEKLDDWHSHNIIVKCLDQTKRYL